MDLYNNHTNMFFHPMLSIQHRYQTFLLVLTCRQYTSSYHLVLDLTVPVLDQLVETLLQGQEELKHQFLLLPVLKEQKAQKAQQEQKEQIEQQQEQQEEEQQEQPEQE